MAAAGTFLAMYDRTPCLIDSAMVSTFTFWRFLIQIPLAESEMKIQYSITGGLEMDFFVPSHRQTMRLAAYSVSDPNRHCTAPSL